jgi:hypothetical protein
MFRSAVTVDLSGGIDRPRLEALRSALRLRPEGRLEDGWDEILGRRVDEVPGGRIQILLYRADDPGPWAFHVNVDGDPAADALRAVQDELVAAARANGMAVAGVSHRSTPA